MPKGADFLKGFAKNLLRASSTAEVISLQNLEGSMKIRIHRFGQGTEGRPLTPYRSYWKNVREEAGFQTAYKDLEFTGALRKNFAVGTSQGNNAIGFLNNLSRKIAEGQEDQNDQKIYALSDSERRQLFKKYGEVLSAEINAIYGLGNP